MAMQLVLNDLPGVKCVLATKSTANQPPPTITTMGFHSNTTDTIVEKKYSEISNVVFVEI